MADQQTSKTAAAATTGEPAVTAESGAGKETAATESGPSTTVEPTTVEPTTVEPPAVGHWTTAGGGADDDDDDRDSALGDDSQSSTASISASILEYRRLHGRTYHAQQGSGDYWGPNDSRQNESMDTTHYAMTMMLDDKSHLAPLPATLGKVLDVGTGSGLWAIDFADEHPEAQVIGTDLSPSQPTAVPPNLQFEVDDATLLWTFQPESFDYIHIRNLFGSIADWNALYAEAYKAAKPGSWVESYEVSGKIYSDDSTVLPGMALYDWGRLFESVGKKTGRVFEVIDNDIVEDAFKAAGFVDITVKKMKMPMTGYPEDERQQKIGIYNHFATEQGLEGYALLVLTQIMGWQQEQVQIFIAQIRKELRLKKVHPYVWSQVVYGRKPDA